MTLTLLLALLLSPARADIVPPSPPDRGAATEDLPPPPLPGGDPLPLALALGGGALFLVGVGVMVGRRR